MKLIYINKFYLLLILSIMPIYVYGQLNVAQPYPDPDARFKSDILLVVAHPDDETAIGSFLAKMVFDENKKIAIVYTNRGNGGGNSIGNEQSTAMGLIRETEVRRAVASYGIFNVWFLDGSDTPGQDVFHSLKNLNHGAALEKLVRITRLTRPEIIITWLPQYSSGENHGDHQAASIIATESFSMAGDPTVYPTQLASPRERTDINNYNEGLQVWQPKKLYFYSDREIPIKAEGPKFDITEMSPSKHKPYYKISTSLMKPHQVQANVAEIARLADETGDYSKLIKWLSKFNLIYGKSLVECSPNGNIFEGITDEPLDFVPVSYLQKKMKDGISFEFGGVFSFYKKFWKKHGIEHIASLVDPEVSVAAGSIMHFPLKITNSTNDTVKVSIKLNKPEGWEEWSGSAVYIIPPNKIYEKEAFISVPYNLEHAKAELSWAAAEGDQNISEGTKSELFWTATEGDHIINKLKLHVDIYEWVLPQ